MGGGAAVSVETPIGTFGVEASAAGLRRVRLPGDGLARPSVPGGEPAAGHAAMAAEQVCEYASGERDLFELDVDWTDVEPTHRRVLETLREIAPFGATVTYGELGRRAGVERSAS